MAELRAAAALRPLCVFAALFALALSGPAQAALPDEIQVYTDDINKPGERGLELHVNATPRGRTVPDYPGEVTTQHGLRITPEISLGLTRDVDVGLYLPFVRSAAGTDYFAGPKFRVKWLPQRPAGRRHRLVLGLNGELAFVARKFEQAGRSLELRPIIGWRGEQWLFAANPSIGIDLAGADRGVPMFGPSVKLAREVAKDVSVGLEYYAELGRLGRWLPHAEQSHTIFLVLDAEKQIGFNLGIGRGLTDASDRWTLKAILSF